jgi:ribosome biogenesis GTPase A
MNENKTNINWYPGHMAKTKRLISENINKIDVVYEVIDARMPYSSKIKDIKNYINNKPVILIMTKTDLCDMKETSKWMKYYENLGYKVLGIDLEHNPNLKKIINATNEIMQEKVEKRIDKGMIKRKTRVLVVGIPNCGKSTLINRLAGKKVVGTGNRPGITKELSWIRVNDEVELLDTPGILWPKLDQETVALNLASLSAIKEEILPIYNVFSYIIETLYKYYPNILEERYGIKELKDDMIENMDIIGKRRGCILKGNEIDYEKVMNIVMNDIKSGIIKNITFERVSDYE